MTRYWKIGRLLLGFDWRSRKDFLGRFGGGWNWKLGFQSGGSTVIISLLIFSVRVSWQRKEENF